MKQSRKEQKMDTVFQIRLTTAEKVELKRLAGARNLEVAPYIRFCIQKLELDALKNKFFTNKKITA